MAESRGEEAAEFYRSYDILRETWHYQGTPQGAWVIAVTEYAPDSVRKTEEYVRSQRPFERWFKEKILKFSGIDTDQQPLGPITELILSWNGERVLAP